MGTPREVPPAKLFVGVMHRPHFDPEPVLETLADRYGPVDARCPPFIFDGSRYYEPEMGPGLVKLFVSFRVLVPQERLAAVKLETNELESRGIDARGRVCNLDPGIITHYSVILATTKGYANRICTSLPSSLRSAWKGVLKPRHFLGVRLVVMTMSWISSSDIWSMSI
jgi:hypothetical protein